MADFVESSDFDNEMSLDLTLADYVRDLNQEWADYIESNYVDRWDEYNRIWRGEWAPEDKTRDSERSRLVTPGTQQAVESSVAEVEEATFGRGRWFDVTNKITVAQPQAPKPPMAPQGPQAGPPMPPQGPGRPMGPSVGPRPQMPPTGPQGAPQGPSPEEALKAKGHAQDLMFAQLREKLYQEFSEAQVRQCIGEVLINAAVYGTGIGEVVLEEVMAHEPASSPIMGGQLQAIGVNITPKVQVKLNPVLPHNFRIDPVATRIDNAHGVAIEQFVSKHSVTKLQEEGYYKDIAIGVAAPDWELEPDKELSSTYNEDKVKLIKYYGLVPRHLLEEEEESDMAEFEVIEELVQQEDDGYYVEAIVVIANDEYVLKAEANPYMMKDRPIVAFSWDVVPGVFWGRGVCEKAYNTQKALDAEMRARIDALALTAHPMMAMDVSRIPRGSTPEIRPGKTILTNGPPSETLMPFNFGQVSQITFEQSASLQQMLQQATGALDSTGLAQSMGDARTGAVSMSLGAVIKRQKRTLVNFQETFLLPFVAKAAWRYMQFAPDDFPIGNYNFIASSTLGIVAREYENQQLTQLLGSMPPESPQYNIILKSVIDNMSVADREKILAELDKASQPNPEAQQAAKAAQEAQMEFQKSQSAALQAQAAESQARAQKYTAEAEAVPQETQIKAMDAVSKNIQPGIGDDIEFERRLKIAELRLREKESTAKFRQNAGPQQGSRPPAGPPSQ